MTADVVGLDSVNEEVEIHHNSHQQWYYLSGQLPSELLIFKSVDSEAESGMSSGNMFQSSLFELY
jgi:hypothetical protein